MVELTELNNQYKLVSTSDMKKAKDIGKTIGIFSITHGEPAHVDYELIAGGEILIVTYKGELYEFEQSSI